MATRTWEKKSMGGYIETAGEHITTVDDVRVLPADGAPEQVIVRFKNESGDAITNTYRFFKNDGSENFGAIRAFEALLGLKYGPGQTIEWSEEDLVGLGVLVTVEPSEYNGKTYYNVTKVDVAPLTGDDDI